MSYRIRLLTTHAITAIVAGYCVWFGLQVHGFTRLAFVVLFSAAIIVPMLFASWWLARSLRNLNRVLVDVSGGSTETGIPELDHVARQVTGALARQRSLAQNVGDLVLLLGQSASRSEGTSVAAGSGLLTDALGNLSRTTARDVGGILALADDVARGAHDTTCGTQEQLRTIENATSAAQTLSTTTDSVAREANASRKAAADVADRATDGLDLIESLLSGLDQIQANVERSEKKVTTLGQQSEQIAAIVETMQKLSARTDMLALNASIEAVRAGREGSGFALVADEVRKLAETTSNASRNIAGLAISIQTEAGETVSVLAEGRRQVQEEIRLAGETGRSLEAINRVSTSAATRAQQIAGAAVEQLQCTQEMVRAMQQVSSVANRIGERGESIRSKTSDIVLNAQKLEDGLSPLYHYGDSDEAATTSHRITASDAVPQPATNPSSPDELIQAVTDGEFAQ